MTNAAREAILKRIDALLVVAQDVGSSAKYSEAFQGTMNLVRAVYGLGSAQERQLQVSMGMAEKEKVGDWGHKLRRYVAPSVQGTLAALKDDIEAGVVGNLVMRGSGEVLGDMLGLAKDALGTAGDAEKNVAAVLVAASFEDTLRRLASTKAGVVDRPKLEDVIGKLKAAGVLVGPSVSIANGYLKFRNDALHADWDHIQPTTIGSCLAFVEGLLLEHFS